MIYNHDFHTKNNFLPASYNNNDHDYYFQRFQNEPIIENTINTCNTADFNNNNNNNNKENNNTTTFSKLDNYKDSYDSIKKIQRDLLITGDSSSSLKSDLNENTGLESSIVNKLNNNFSGKFKTIFMKSNRIKILVEPEIILDVAKYLKNEIGLDHAESAGGTDFPKDNQIEVIYHLGSYSRDDLYGLIFSLSTRTNRDNARLPSLISIFNSVEYHERETFEMLGVYFEGHPRNERFLLPEDWADIPPLRKDFSIKGR